jgi:hypothetical protein
MQLADELQLHRGNGDGLSGDQHRRTEQARRCHPLYSGDATPSRPDRGCGTRGVTDHPLSQFALREARVVRPQGVEVPYREPLGDFQQDIDDGPEESLRTGSPSAISGPPSHLGQQPSHQSMTFRWLGYPAG